MIRTAKQRFQDKLVLPVGWLPDGRWGEICGFQIGPNKNNGGEKTEWVVPSQFLGIDITDWLIASFTGVLVVLNGFLVFYNWRLSRATKISADAAKQAADATKKQAALAEKALLVSEFADVHVAQFEGLINARGTWVLTATIKSDRLTYVESVHFKLRVRDSLDEKKVRRVRSRISPREPSVATVRTARIPKNIDTLQATVTVYYDNPLGLDSMRSISAQYWIYSQPDNSLEITKKDPKDRFLAKQ